LSVANVTFKNSEHQSISASLGEKNINSEVRGAFAESNTGDLYLHLASSNAGTYVYSGDVELDSKPTWI